MRGIHALVICSGAMCATPAGAQVVLDMPAPPSKSEAANSVEPATEASADLGIAGYDTFDQEPLYADAGDVALFRYAGFRNFPRVTTVPSFRYPGGYYNSFNGPWVYPPIVGWPIFFTNHHGFHGGHHQHHHGGFHHFGGFHGHFRFGGDHFRGHVRIGF